MSLLSCWYCPVIWTLNTKLFTNNFINQMSVAYLFTLYWGTLSPNCTSYDHVCLSCFFNLINYLTIMLSEYCQVQNTYSLCVLIILCVEGHRWVLIFSPGVGEAVRGAERSAAESGLWRAGGNRWGVRCPEPGPLLGRPLETALPQGNVLILLL